MSVNREIGFCGKVTLAMLVAIVIALAFRGKANAATYSDTAPELHFAQVLIQNEDYALIMLEDGNIWQFEGLSMDTYGQAYIIDEGNPTGFTLIDIDTMVGVCISSEGNCDGTLIMDNGEIADPIYNYISYRDVPNVRPGDVVITTDYRVKGTCDDIIYRDDVITHNIYERR